MATPPSQPEPASAVLVSTPQQKLVLTIAITASFVAFLDGTVVNVALPAILAEFGGTVAVQQWVVDAYLITLGALILVAGSASDVYGRLRVMRIGLIAFGVTSLAIALAPSAPVLIVARLLQGAAGALLVPSSLALIMTHFSGAARGRAIGTWTAMTSAAMIVGPVVGGLFVDYASWRWAFILNVAPIGVALYLLTRVASRDVRLAGARVDLISAVLAVAGLGGVVWALIEAPTLGWGSPAIWGPAVVGVAAFVAFLRRQGVVDRPMLPLSWFAARNFAWGNLATALIYGALALVAFVLGVYLQEGAGLSATAAGVAQLPITVMLILLSSRAGALAARWGPRVFMTVGPLVMAVGVAMMLSVSEEFVFWTQVLPGVVVFGVGLGVLVAPLTAAVLGAVDAERSGIASAVNNAVSRIAGLVAIALIGVIAGGSLDLAGFHRSLVVSAGLLVAGGVVSWVGIRRAPASVAGG